MRDSLKKKEEQELVTGCIKKNRTAQEQLYRKYAKKMYNICLSYAHDTDDAKDILQDGFIKVFRNIRKFSNSGSLEGWIRRIITNTAIDYYRRKSKDFRFIPEERAWNEKEYSEGADTHVRTEDLLEMVNRLPDGARLVFNLYSLEGYTHREISKRLNISEGTSKSQVNRARNLLKVWIMEEDR